MYTIGVDVGGTYTDLVAIDDTGKTGLGAHRQMRHQRGRAQPVLDHVDATILSLAGCYGLTRPAMGSA